MSVTEANTIDMIGVNVERGSVSLGVSDHLPWDEQSSEQHLLALQDKLNSYLRFIESGEIYSAYPNAAGRPVEIEVLFKFTPSAIALQFMEQARQLVVNAGAELHWKVL